MKKNFSCVGKWFLPDNTEKVIVGNLKYEKGGLIELSLDGSFGEGFISNLIHYIIVGETSYGRITLINCLGYSVFGDSTFTCKSFFLGGIFLKKEDLFFKNVNVSLNTLNEWANMSGFKIDQYVEDKKYIVSYKKPDSIAFNLDDKVEANLSFYSENPIDRIDRKILLKQEVYIHLLVKDDEKIFFNDLLNYVARFQNFLALGTYKNPYPLEINFSQEELGTNVEFYTVYDVKHYAQPRTPYDFLFSYKAIEDEFIFIIESWFSNYKSLEPVIYLLTDSIYDSLIFNENKFLNIINALESFHRRRINNERLPREEYDIMIKAIRESVPNEYVDYVKNKIHGNEPTLHERLEKLISEYSTSTFESVVPDVSQFIKDTKNSRNYYTHLDIASEGKALKGEELFKLTEKLKMILYAAILIETGFSKDKVGKILENYYGFFSIK